MTLYLVRHGRAAAGVEHLDPELDPVGRSQAARAAEVLSSVGARRLVCSPLLRTRQTAEPVASALGLTVELQPAVAEVFLPGEAADVRRAMLGPFLAGRWSEQPAPLREWRDRVVRALVELGGETTIVVSHFVAISAAIGVAMGDDRVSPCAIANASITTLDVVDGRLALGRAGDVSHLPPDERTITHAPVPGLR